MQKLTIPLFIALLFHPIFCIGEELLLFRVHSVQDGDSVILKDRSNTLIPVDLYGIDAPELDQQAGEYAQRLLRAMIKGKRVASRNGEQSGDNRRYVLLELDGSSINGAMVRAGYAWVHPELCALSACSRWDEHQNFARSQKKGLWQYGEPVEPWIWSSTGSMAGPVDKRVTFGMTGQQSSPTNTQQLRYKNYQRYFINRGKTTINAYEYRPYLDRDSYSITTKKSSPGKKQVRNLKPPVRSRK